jgi:hypothetical protein
MPTEPLLTGSERYLLHKQIFGLSVCCPFDHDNPWDCPLHEVRKMGVMERCEWLHGQTNPQMLDILDYHQKCLMGKMELKQRSKLTLSV